MIQLFQNDLASSNENVSIILELFNSKPDFNVYGIISSQHYKCNVKILDFSIQIVKDHGLLNAKMLSENVIVIFQRDQSNQVVPLSNHKHVISRDQIYIR